MSDPDDKKMSSHIDFTLDDYRPRKKSSKSKKGKCSNFSSCKCLSSVGCGCAVIRCGGTKKKKPNQTSRYSMDEHYCESSSSYGKRRWCCSCQTTSLIIFIFFTITFLAVITTTIYLGVETNGRLRQNVLIQGRIRIIAGDTYSMMLDDSRSNYYKHKIKQYEDKLTKLYNGSSLKNSVESVKVYGFRNGSLVVLFGVFVNRMTMSKELRDERNVKMAVKKVLMDELTSTRPRIFVNVIVDPHTVVLSEDFAEEVDEKKHDDHYYYTMDMEKAAERESEDMYQTPTESTRRKQKKKEQQQSEIRKQTWTTLAPLLPDMYISNTKAKPGQSKLAEHVHEDVYGSLEHKPERLESRELVRTPMKLTAPKTGEVKNIRFNFDPWVPLTKISKRLEVKKPLPKRTATIDDIPPRGKPFNIPPRGGPSVLRPILPIKLIKSENSTANFANSAANFTNATDYANVTDEKASKKSHVAVESSDSINYRQLDSEHNNETFVHNQNIEKTDRRSQSKIKLMQQSKIITASTHNILSETKSHIFKQPKLNLRENINYKEERVKTLSATNLQNASNISMLTTEHLRRYRKSVDGAELTISDGDEMKRQFLGGRSRPLKNEHMRLARVSSVGRVQEIKLCKSGFLCDTGECIDRYSRCNQIKDCWDNSDERDCKCVEKIKAMLQDHKICDGVPDCLDHSDEQNCLYCKPGQFKCPNSRTCIEQSQVCNAISDCPNSADEAKCLMLSPGPKLNSLTEVYHNSGYLMVRRNGVWGHMCMDRFNKVQSQSDVQLSIFDIGQVVCYQLTYKNLTEVRIVDIGKRHSTQTELFYNFRHNQEEQTHTVYTRSATEKSITDNGLVLLKAETKCLTRKVLHVSCSHLECGLRPNRDEGYRIVGGDNADLGSWPWHAALYKEGKYQCGASLISQRWLISAAHCFNNYLDKFWVARLGLLRRGANNIISPFEQMRNIDNIFVHEEYKLDGFINDITLLKMDRPVQFSNYIRPICLPKPNAPIQEGKMCTVIGWGQLHETGSIYPDTLQEVRLPLISTKACKMRSAFSSVHKVTAKQFCAGYERGGRDACVGDSGGPILCKENSGRWTLMGVTSNGFGCARPGYPGVYTKVTDYLTWIKETIEKKDDIKQTPSFCSGHRCPLGQCLSLKQICNGYIECQDGSDERDCHKKT